MARPYLPLACFGFTLAFVPATFAFQATITPRVLARPTVEPPGLLRSDSSLVVIPTHVTTDIGASVTSLTKENFRLIEDNVEQPIVHFDKDDAPLSIGLLFDRSGSMRDKMQKAEEAVTAFFKTANTADEFFLVEFSDRARLTVPFTPDSGMLFERISHTKPFGMTSLLDAIHLSLGQMKKAHNLRKALVVISDGGDNWSRHSAREVRNTLVESDVQLYSMGIFDPDYSTKHEAETRNGPALLDELAKQTGGRNFPVDNLNDLPSISAKIGNELRNEYLLGYYSGAVRDGKYHQVRVKLTGTDDLPPLRTYFRKGYYAPQ
ncbi:MAG TPA: VWA domain-containing protein [Bryobacteraceae bacterium]|jgi:Ca-activated chloride channel family protein|nr:VWA domain-containing protein [Bryobacteraceae bacterium]